MDNSYRVAPGWVDNGGGDLRRLITEEDFYNEFRTYLCGVLGRSHNTAKGYIGMGRMAAKRLGKHILKIDSDDLIALIGRESWSPATKRAVIVAMHQIDAFAAMKSYGTRNGIAHLKTPKVPRNKRAPLHNRDAYRLLQQATSPIQARVTYLGLYAGLRIQESTELTEAQWLEDALVFHGKGAKKRRVPVHPELRRVRELILSKQPSSKTSAGVIFGRLRDTMNLKDKEGRPATPHTLRRTFATELYRWATWEEVGTLLGHDLGTTDSYVQFGEERMQEVVAPLEYRSGEPEQLRLFG